MTRRPRLRFALAALLLLGGAWTGIGRAAAEIANPTLLPRDILALRGMDWSEPQLHLVFDKTVDGKPAPTLEILIGSDYFDIIDGARQSIEDLKLHRRFIVDESNRTLVNLSLFGEVMFRRVELLRRMQLAQSLAGQKGHPPIPQSLDRFWIESELGMTWQRKGQPAEIVTERTQGNKVGFLHRGEEVASFEPSGRLLPDGTAHGFRAFLHDALPLHPHIAEAIAGSGEIPARLQFVSEAKGKSETVVLSLRQAEASRGPFPLPRHLSLVLVPEGTGDPEAALMRQVLPNMIDAIAGRAQGGPRSIASYRIAIDEAIRHGAVFEAVLRLTELALQWGRDAAACDTDVGAGPCHSRREINQLIHRDPRSTALFKAAALERSAPQKAATIWRGILGQNVPGDYVVEIFLAQLLSKEGRREEAAHSFTAAFAGDSYIPLLYRELGNHFARVSRLDLAWLCYDLGRALPHRRQNDALSGIDEVEREMVETYPDLF